jgi:hypothetical protein
MSRLVRDPVDILVPALRQPTVNREVEQRLGDLEGVEDFWHVVGSGAPEPAFSANWSSYDGGVTYGLPRFRKMHGVVFLDGMAKKSTAVVAGEVVFTLPVGYRPSYRLNFPVQSNNSLGRVDIVVGGGVSIEVGSAGWVSFNGISFAL